MAAFSIDTLPLFVPQFLTDTAELDNASAGAYIRLLCFQWQAGDLPIEEEKLARLVGESKTKFYKIWKIIGEKFVKKSDKRIHNLKLEEVRKDKINFKATLSQSGRDGAAVRWGRHKDANEDANGKQDEEANAKYKYNTINTPNGVSMSPENGDFSNEGNQDLKAVKKAGKAKITKPIIGADGEKQYPEREGTCYTFFEFWNDYDKKVDKDDAYAQFQKVNEANRALIRVHVAAYKISQPNKKYRTNPAGYLRNEKWKNEIIGSSFQAPPVAPIPKETTEPEELKTIYNYNPVENGNS